MGAKGIYGNGKLLQATATLSDFNPPLYLYLWLGKKMMTIIKYLLKCPGSLFLPSPLSLPILGHQGRLTVTEVTDPVLFGLEMFLLSQV